MLVTKFEVKNFGRYTEKVVNLGPGLNVIVGLNGSGKSTLVDGMLAALTGEFIGDGVKTDNVRTGTPKGEKSFVSACIQHAGNAAQVTRTLSPTPGRSLTINGTKTGRTEDEVNKALWDMLGVGKAVLTDYAFVPQWQTFSFLTSNPSNRLRVLNRLFRVDHADRLYRLIGEKISLYGSTVVTVDPTRMHEAHKELHLARERLAQLTAKLQSLPGNEDTQLLIDAYLEYQKALKLRQQGEVDRAIRSSRLRDKKEHSVKENEALNRAWTEWTGYQAIFESKIKDYLEAKEVIDSWNEYRTQVRVVEADLKRRQESLNSLQALGKCPQPPALSVEVLSGQLSSMQAVLATTQAFLDAHKHAGEGTCPTCGSPTSADLQTKFETEMKNLHVYRDEVSKLTTQLFNSRQVEKSISDWQRQYDHFQYVLKSLESIATPTPPQKGLEQAQQTITEHEAQANRLSQLKRTWESSRDSVTNLMTEIKNLEAEIEQLDKATVELPPEVSELEYQTSVQTQAEYNATKEAHSFAATAEAAAATALRTLQELVKEGENHVRRTEHLDKLRQVFQPTGLPAKVVEKCLHNLTAGINSKLNRFGSPFSVKVGEQVSFEASFSDGRKVGAGRLSGGEKMILALAFRLSVLEAFGGDLGFLCMDEPTVGLDNDNRVSLVRCLTEASRIAKDGGSQLIVVTHDRQLAAAADYVVDLS